MVEGETLRWAMLGIGVAGLLLAVLLRVVLGVVRRRVEAGRRALEELKQQAQAPHLSMRPEDD